MVQKRQLNKNRIFDVLPAYPGGKRKLVGWIFGQLDQHLPNDLWFDCSFADAFAGGCSVSLYAKAIGFATIRSNDLSNVSQVILQAVIHNEYASTGLTESDLLMLFQPRLSLEKGFVEQEFGGSVLPTRVASLIDTIHFNMRTFLDPTKKAQARLLVWHLVNYYTAFSTNVGTSNRPFSELIDGRRDWWTINPKRFTDGSLGNLYNTSWDTANRIIKRMNSGCRFPYADTRSTQMDAFEFVRSVGTDILYLDPPYAGTLAYEREHRVLEAILYGRYPEEPKTVSPFTEGTEALSELFFEARDHHQVFVLSYGNKVIDLEGLKSLVEKALGNGFDVYEYEKGYRHYTHVSKNADNKELLIIAIDKNGIERGGL